MVTERVVMPSYGMDTVTEMQRPVLQSVHRINGL